MRNLTTTELNHLSNEVISGGTTWGEYLLGGALLTGMVLSEVRNARELVGAFGGLVMAGVILAVPAIYSGYKPT